MKKYLILILFPFLLQAQSLNLLLMDDDAGFDPLAFDANNIALYDGDLELTTDAWGDQTTNNYDITFGNSPTIGTGSLNGHNIVTLNGSDEFGNNTSISLTQPFTIYMVVNQVTLTSGDRIIGANVGDWSVAQWNPGENILLYAGSLFVVDPLVDLDSYNVMTWVFNGASSISRTNSETATVSDAGGSAWTGICLAAKTSSSDFGNIGAAYLIIRSGADDTAAQDIFIDFLKARFGL